MNSVGFKRAEFASAVSAGNEAKVAGDTSLSFGDMQIIGTNLQRAGMSERQAESFGRLYELAAKQTPPSEKLDAFQTALNEYKDQPNDNGKKGALFSAAYALLEAESKTLSEMPTATPWDKAFKSALANACFGTVGALDTLSQKDGFKSTENDDATWLKKALPEFQQTAALAKLEKRGLHVGPISKKDAIDLLKNNPSAKIIGSKVENGKLVFCELELNGKRDGLVEKKKPNGDPGAYELSKKFARTFNPTAGQTPVVSMPPQRPAINDEHVATLRGYIATAHDGADNQTIWDAFCKLADVRNIDKNDNWEATLLQKIQNDGEMKARFNAILEGELTGKAASDASGGTAAPAGTPQVT
jgi:hypothetical protein